MPKVWEKCQVCGGQGWYDVCSNNEYGVEARRCQACKGRGGRYLSATEQSMRKMSMERWERESTACAAKEGK